MNKEDILSVVIILCLLLIIILIVKQNSTIVYRFYKPDCPFCKESKAEWKKFKRLARYHMIRFRDINLQNTTKKNEELFKILGGTTVPFVVKVLPDHRFYVYTGDRTAGDYLDWVCNSE